MPKTILARVRTYWSYSEDDGGSECDGGEEDCCTPVLPDGDVTPVLEAFERDRNVASAPVSALVVFDGLKPRFSTSNAGPDALRLQGIPEPVGIIAAIAE